MFESIHAVAVLIGLLCFIGLNLVWISYVKRKGDLGIAIRLVPTDPPSDEPYEPQKDVVLEEFPKEGQGFDQGAAESMRAHLSLYTRYEIVTGLVIASIIAVLEALYVWDETMGTADVGVLVGVCASTICMITFRAATMAAYILCKWVTRAPEHIRRDRTRYFINMACCSLLMVAGAIAVAVVLMMHVPSDIRANPITVAVAVLPVIMLAAISSSDSLVAGWSCRNVLSLVLKVVESAVIAIQFVVLTEAFP
jgi:hypothetical protein